MLLGALLILLVLSLALGSETIHPRVVLGILFGEQGCDPRYQHIVMDFRLVKTLAAALAGASLGISGLMMQTLFRNPLADPFVLGVSSGASLGVALAVMGGSALGIDLLAPLGMSGHISICLAALVGAGAVMGLILLSSRLLGDNLALLLLGLMFGYAAGAMVSILLYMSSSETSHSYIIWSFGSFAGVSWDQLLLLFTFFATGTLLSLRLLKDMNALLLGENYAKSLGVNTSQVRFWLIAISSALAAIVTASCGPVAFIGLAVPHLARLILKTGDQRLLFPGCMLAGAATALLADIVARLPGIEGQLPLNAVTCFFGAPVVIWLVLRQRRMIRS
ncbi:MAG: iron ABC transporter permease [Planctomycetes bacterium]|nr:iron ABC transporter permease [Planctomycetota bacterium]